MCFLAVAPGTRFRFWLRWLDRASTRPLTDDEKAHVWTWLDKGLEYLGLGAKTSAGYGHFRAASPRR